jgi:nitrogen fixation protein NifQ
VQGHAQLQEAPPAPTTQRGPRAESDEGFDRRILGRVFLHAALQGKRLGDSIVDQLGLDCVELAALKAFLRVEGFVLNSSKRTSDPEDEELMVRALLMGSRSIKSPVGDWFACIVARRALEPNHLWEDLGLAARSDLSRLLLRHFAGIAGKNTRNMRWKKFLYRALCEAEGFTMCPSPTCDSCAEFDVCFDDESGASALARNKKSGAI